MPSRTAPRFKTPRRFGHRSQPSKYLKVRLGNRSAVVNSCEFHANGRYFLSADNRGQIQINDADDGFEKLKDFKGHKLGVTEVHFSRDGESIYSGSMDRTVVIWDALRAIRKSVIFGHQTHVYSVQCSPATLPMICSGSSDKTVRVWDLRQRSCGAMLPIDQHVSSTCFSSCGNYIFVGGFDNGNITAWDIRQNESVHRMTGHGLAVTGLTLSPCGKYLASSSADNTVRKWSVSSADEIEEVQRYDLLQNELRHLRRSAWSPDGRMLTSGTNGRKGIVFDAESGEILQQLGGHRDSIIDLAFHPTRPMLVSAGADKNVIVHKI